MWPLYVSFLIFSFAKYSFFITWNTKFKLTNMDKLSMRCIFYSHFQFTHFRVDRLWSWHRREAWCFLWTEPAPQPLALWRPRWCSSALVPTLQDRPPFTAPRLTRCSIWGECCSIVSQECLASGICWLSLSMKCWFTLLRIIKKSTSMNTDVRDAHHVLIQSVLHFLRVFIYFFLYAASKSEFCSLFVDLN